jgi:NTE family protein
VAVSLAGEPEDQQDSAPVHESSEPRPDEEWYERFRHSAAQVLDSETMRRLTGWFGSRRNGEAAENSGVVVQGAFGDLPPELGLLDVMELSLESVQSVLTRYRMAGYPPDLLISIPKHACRTLDFHRGAEMIALGREVTEQALSSAALIKGE